MLQGWEELEEDQRWSSSLQLGLKDYNITSTTDLCSERWKSIREEPVKEEESGG